jgi:glutaredoxin-like protein
MTTQVKIYWRPGCPFCSRLRRDIQHVGLPVREINIWNDSSAAAAVRSVAGGNETVPTVMVGDHAMVNPTALQVLHVVREQAPELLDAVNEDAVRRLARGSWWSAALVSAVAATVWFLLATGHPTTTYHFAPLLVAAAWPITHRWRSREALAPFTVLATAAGGIGVASATTALLAARHALAGPTVTGSANAVVETFSAIAAGAVVGGVMAAVGRRTVSTRT